MFFNFFRAASPPIILPLVLLNCSSQFSFSSAMTPRDFIISTLFMSELFSLSISGRSRILVLSGCPMIMNSVFFSDSGLVYSVQHNSPEEVLHGRTKYWHLIYIFLKFAHICCCSSSHCGVPALKLIHVLSLQASSDPTSDIGIVSFSSSI